MEVDEQGPKCRGQLRAWLPFKPQVYADDMKSMFGDAMNNYKPGARKTISMQYEIHNIPHGSSQLNEDSVEIAVAVYDRSKYKWQTLDFKMLADYWTGGIYKTSPNSCVLVLHERGPRPFGLAYHKRRASDIDVSPKDVEVMKEKGWTFPKQVQMTLMVDGIFEGGPVTTTLQVNDNKVNVPLLAHLNPHRDLTTLYDCGYSIAGPNQLIKMCSTQAPPPYPDPEVLAGPFYQDVHEPAPSGPQHTLATEANPMPPAPEPIGAPSKTASAITPQVHLGRMIGNGALAGMHGAGAMAGGGALGHRMSAAASGAGSALAPPANGMPRAQLPRPHLPPLPGPATEQQAQSPGDEHLASDLAAHVLMDIRHNQAVAANQAGAAPELAAANKRLGKSNLAPTDPQPSRSGPRAPAAVAGADGNGPAAVPAQVVPAVSGAASRPRPQKGRAGGSGEGALEHRASVQSGPERHGALEQPGYTDVTEGPRPGGDTNNQPCFICKKKVSRGNNALYLCDNDCGWAGHRNCLQMPPGSEPEMWFCCLGCEQDYQSKQETAELHAPATRLPDSGDKKRRGTARPPKPKSNPDRAYQEDEDGPELQPPDSPPPEKKQRAGGKARAEADRDAVMAAGGEEGQGDGAEAGGDGGGTGGDDGDAVMADAGADAGVGAPPSPGSKKIGRPRKAPLLLPGAAGAPAQPSPAKAGKGRATVKPGKVDALPAAGAGLQVAEPAGGPSQPIAVPLGVVGGGPAPPQNPNPAAENAIDPPAQGPQRATSQLSSPAGSQLPDRPALAATAASPTKGRKAAAAANHFAPQAPAAAAAAAAPAERPASSGGAAQQQQQQPAGPSAPVPAPQQPATVPAAAPQQQQPAAPVVLPPSPAAPAAANVSQPQLQLALADAPAGPPVVFSGPAITLPQPSFIDNTNSVSAESRLTIMTNLARLLRHLNRPQAIRPLIQAFRDTEDVQDATLQVTYNYMELKLCWEVQDIPGVLQVFRERYGLPV